MKPIQLNLADDRSRHPQYLARTSEGVIEEANAAFLTLLGYERSDLGRLREQEAVERACLFDKDSDIDTWVRCRPKSGSSFVMGQTCLTLTSDGRDYKVVTLWDTNLQEKVLNRLLLSEQIFETAMDGILVTDSQGIIQYVNPSFIRITGYEAEELFGMTPRVLNSGRHDEAFYHNLWTALQQEGNWNGEIWNRRKNGEVYPEWLAISSMRDPQGNILMYTAMFRDLSERYEYEQRIKYQALHDPLTDLPNRRFFHDKLKAATEKARRQNDELSLIYLDLDGFKLVNDRLGHEAGDQVLRVAAERILRCVGDRGTSFRMGGDEFTILLEAAGDDLEQVTREISASILAEIRQPVNSGYETAVVGSSLGLAFFPADGQDQDSLLLAADHRMYQAKRAGRNRIVG
jgi:diguanylate cyclase (GGDEF)-like protein/PAS domain S-box-containing protein